MRKDIFSAADWVDAVSGGIAAAVLRSGECGVYIFTRCIRTDGLPGEMGAFKDSAFAGNCEGQLMDLGQFSAVFCQVKVRIGWTRQSMFLCL